MDRIDELLVRLIDEQDTATFHQCMRSPNRAVADLDRSKALIRRDALRDEIAADWRAMAEALEEAKEQIRHDYESEAELRAIGAELGVSEWEAFMPIVWHKLNATLARVKGES